MASWASRLGKAVALLKTRARTRSLLFRKAHRGMRDFFSKLRGGMKNNVAVEIKSA